MPAITLEICYMAASMCYFNSICFRLRHGPGRIEDDW